MATTSSDQDAVGHSSAFEPVILQTKLARPPVRAEHVARPELISLLRRGVTRKLTLLAAPLGYGKTTLLCEWAAAEDGAAVAWLSLDDEDNDPTRFVGYVIEALRTLQPEVGARAQAAQGTPGRDCSRSCCPCSSTTWPLWTSQSRSSWTTTT